MAARVAGVSRRVVVVGAGLAGLVAAIRLAREGARVTVVAKGAGSLHLSPGTVDVLGYGPERIEAPREALAAFTAANPEHPYGALAPHLEEAVAWFRETVPDMRLQGDLGRNMLLPTAVGVPRPTALAPAGIAAGDLSAIRRLAVVGLRPLKDFFPRLLAENLSRSALPGGARVEARPLEVALSPRPGHADVGGPVYARAFDDPDFRARFADALRVRIEADEHVALPAVLGLRRAGEAWDDLSERLGTPVIEIPTLPPSVPGMRLQHELLDALAAAGGRLVLGPVAVGPEGSGGRLSGVLVRDAVRERAIPADAVVLATGGFSAGGLELDSTGVLSETVFGLPVAGPPDGAARLSPRQLDHQPLMSAGVAVDDALRPVDPSGAAVWDNLHAAGTIVAGASPWREKSGEGIAIAGGHRAASAILEGP